MKLSFRETICLKNSKKKSKELANKYDISYQTVRKIILQSYATLLKEYSKGESPSYVHVVNIYPYKQGYRVVFDNKMGIYSKLIMNASEYYLLSPSNFGAMFSLLANPSKKVYITRVLKSMGYKHIKVAMLGGLNELDKPFMAVADGKRFYWNTLLEIISKFKENTHGSKV